MPSDQVIEDLIALWRVFHEISAPLQRGEITAQQYWLMAFLRRRGSQTVGQLAEGLRIAQSSVTAACKRLERDGLVTRERGTVDERVVLISLTERGLREVEGWRQRRREALADLLTPLSQGERDELHGLIRKVLLDDAARRSIDAPRLDEAR